MSKKNPATTRQAAPGNVRFFEGLTLYQSISLPYVTGDDKSDPESVDVYIEQAADGKPYANLVFVPSGPATFMVLGWGPAQLRLLAEFLNEAADQLEYYEDHKP